jgi:hypothetical protein
MIYTEKRLGGQALPELRAGVDIRLPFRTMEFIGSTSQVLAVYVPQNGCLRIFDPGNDDVSTYSRFPEAITAPIPLSNPDLILANALPRVLPSPPFTKEPAHGWCYFYEQAELARQNNDWALVSELGLKAAVEGHQPLDPFEWLPFIEAEALIGDANWAGQTSRAALQMDGRLQRGLCSLWKRVEVNGTTQARATGADMRTEMHCIGQ